jgi:DNA polymerase III delta subunit
VFKLVDSVTEGDLAEALRQLRILVGSPQKAEDAAFRTILPQLSRSLRLIWQARVCADAGVQPGNAPESVKNALLTKPNLASEKDFVRNKAMRAARRISLPQIAEMLSVLSDADSKMKGLLPAFSAMETLEQTVLKMAEVARAKAGAGR